MAKYLDWFTTRNGRWFMRASVGLTGISIFSTYFICHGPMQNRIKKTCQVYSNGKPKPLSSYTRQLVNTVLRESGLKDEEKKRIKFFNVVGLEMFHVGGTNYPWGTLVGVPFHFESQEHIPWDNLRIQGYETIDWLLDGHDLLTALCLSDDAKKFAILREIHSCDIWNVVDNACLSSGFFVLAGEFIRRCNNKWNLLQKLSRKSRVVFYLSIYASAFLFYRCCKDPLKHLNERKLDRIVAEKGGSYLEGAIEFYEKELQRNQVLRELLGSEGKRLYNLDGDRSYFLLMSKLPIRKRLDYLREMKQEQAVMHTA